MPCDCCGAAERLTVLGRHWDSGFNRPAPPTTPRTQLAVFALGRLASMTWLLRNNDSKWT
jgi:hypothetical protein